MIFCGLCLLRFSVSLELLIKRKWNVTCARVLFWLNISCESPESTLFIELDWSLHFIRYPAAVKLTACCLKTKLTSLLSLSISPELFCMVSGGGKIEKYWCERQNLIFNLHVGNWVYSGLCATQIMEFKARFLAWWNFCNRDALWFECGRVCMCLF